MVSFGNELNHFIYHGLETFSRSWRNSLSRLSDSLDLNRASTWNGTVLDDRIASVCDDSSDGRTNRSSVGTKAIDPVTMCSPSNETVLSTRARWPSLHPGTEPVDNNRMMTRATNQGGIRPIRTREESCAVRARPEYFGLKLTGRVSIVVDTEIFPAALVI